MIISDVSNSTDSERAGVKVVAYIKGLVILVVGMIPSVISKIMKDVF